MFLLAIRAGALAMAGALGQLGPTSPIADSAAQDNLCGAVALATASHVIGRPTSLEATINFLPRGRGPWSMGELTQAAERMGLRHRVVEWSREGAGAMPTPAIVCLGPEGDAGRSHFVVVAAAYAGYWQLVDPPRSPRWIAVSGAARDWNGVALHLAPNEAGLPKAPFRYSRHLPAGLGLAASIAAAGVWLSRRPGAGRPLFRPRRSWSSGVLGSALTAALAAAFIVDARESDRSGSLPNAGPSVALLQAETPAIDRRVTPAELASKERMVEFHYHIRNVGQAPARVKAGATSCQCARASIDRQVIDPGETAEVTVRVDVGNEKSRQFRAYVAIEHGLPTRLLLAGSVTVAVK